MKAVVLAIWAISLAAFFLPGASGFGYWGRRLFFGIAIVHAIECVAFLPRLRRAPGSLAHHLVQTFLFGIVHAGSLGREDAAPS